MSKNHGRSGLLVVGRWPLLKLAFSSWNLTNVDAAVGEDCLPGAEIHECESFQTSSITRRAPLWFEMEAEQNHHVKIVVDWRVRASGKFLVKDYILRVSPGQVRVFVGQGPHRGGPAMVEEVSLPVDLV